MKILILGCKGMLGHLLLYRLRECHPDWIVNGVARDYDIKMDNITCDLSCFNELKNIISDEYDVIINTAALLVKDCEIQKSVAIRINSELPHFVMENKKVNCKFIQISTNTLFESTDFENDLFSEVDSSKIHPSRFYDQTKFLGEAGYGNSIVVRTSIIGLEYSNKGRSLLNWFIKQNDVQGYGNSYWNGITTLELVNSIEKLIEIDYHGLIHIHNKNVISKSNLLKIMNEYRCCKADIKTVEGNGSVGLLKSIHDFGVVTKSYDQQIAELVKWVLCHENIYGDIYKGKLKVKKC